MRRFELLDLLHALQQLLKHSSNIFADVFSKLRVVDLRLLFIRRERCVQNIAIKKIILRLRAAHRICRHQLDGAALQGRHKLLDQLNEMNRGSAALQAASAP